MLPSFSQLQPSPSAHSFRFFLSPLTPKTPEVTKYGSVINQKDLTHLRLQPKATKRRYHHLAFLKTPCTQVTHEDAHTTHTQKFIFKNSNSKVNTHKNL